MTVDGALIVESLFDIIWQLFAGWHIPGTNVTPAAAFLFFLAAGIGLRFALRILQQNPSAGDGLEAFKSVRANKAMRDTFNSWYKG